MRISTYLLLLSVLAYSGCEVHSRQASGPQMIPIDTTRWDPPPDTSIIFWLQDSLSVNLVAGGDVSTDTTTLARGDTVHVLGPCRSSLPAYQPNDSCHVLVLERDTAIIKARNYRNYLLDRNALYFK